MKYEQMLEHIKNLPPCPLCGEPGSVSLIDAVSEPISIKIHCSGCSHRITVAKTSNNDILTAIKAWKADPNSMNLVCHVDHKKFVKIMDNHHRVNCHCGGSPKVDARTLNEMGTGALSIEIRCNNCSESTGTFVNHPRFQPWEVMVHSVINIWNRNRKPKYVHIPVPKEEENIV